MRLIWTRSTILSDSGDLITWAYGHQTSHFSIGFFDEAIFFHSHWRGVTVSEYYEFYSNRIKVYEIEVPLSYEEEAEILSAMIDLNGMTKYDYKFFFWLCWYGFKKKILGMEPPAVIEHEEPNSTICHEVLELLPEDVRPDIDFKAALMPDDLFHLCKAYFDEMGEYGYNGGAR